jgi:hypothetical protein
MLIRKYRSSPCTPVRDRSLHSITTAASNAPSTRLAISMPSTPGKVSSAEGAASLLTTDTSLPSAFNA